MRASAPFTSGRYNLSYVGIGGVCGVVGASRWLCGGFGWSPLLGICLAACCFSWGGWLVFLRAGFGVRFLWCYRCCFFPSFLSLSVFFCLLLVPLHCWCCCLFCFVVMYFWVIPLIYLYIIFCH